MTYLEDISTDNRLVVKYVSSERGEGFQLLWDDYAVTVTRAGRSYRVGTLTVYPSGQVLAMRDGPQGDRYACTRKGWAILQDHLGVSRKHADRYATRSMIVGGPRGGVQIERA